MDERTTKANDLLDRDEIRALTERSDLAGAGAVLGTWAVIGGALAMVAWRPHPLTFVCAVVVLGGRQLALAILMHEAAHRTLFRTRALNDWVGDWLCARPVWTDVVRYREHHLGHHAHAGTDRDPDRSLVDPFPVTRAALARKLARDLLFVSGPKRAFGLALMDAERIAYTVANDVRRLPTRSFAHHARALARNAGPTVLVNGAMLAALAVLGHAWVYLAWVVAWLTTYGLFLRIRSIAEHACTEGGRDPLKNTRTTRAGWLARLTVAPHHVAHHLEHHLLPTVPWFRLPALHARLASQGRLPQRAVARGYLEVLRTATTAVHRG